MEERTKLEKLFLLLLFLALAGSISATGVNILGVIFILIIAAFVCVFVYLLVDEVVKQCRTQATKKEKFPWELQ